MIGLSPISDLLVVTSQAQGSAIAHHHGKEHALNLGTRDAFDELHELGQLVLRFQSVDRLEHQHQLGADLFGNFNGCRVFDDVLEVCLLYTSDAADD